VADSALTVARDPALALVVRIFVGAVAERWNVPQPARDDLRLVASELFAGAVEAGAGEDVTFTLTSDGEQVSLQASGVDTLESDGPSDPDGLAGRLELILALFPDADVASPIHILVPVERSDLL
jgi:hypothetical protein